MLVISECVDHRELREFREVDYVLLGEGADDDPVNHPAEHSGSVLDWLAASKLDVVSRKKHGESAQLTDTDFKGDPGQVSADADDVRYLISAANEYFPNHPIEADDVIATWAGLRPLIAPPGDDVHESDISREHQIIIGSDGLITIAGGKLTTFRKMSAEVVDRAVDFLRLANKLPKHLGDPKTEYRALLGARGWPDDEDDDDIQRILQKRTVESSDDILDEATAEYLGYTYGVRAPTIAKMVAENPELATPLSEGRPEILAQVDWGVHMELASTITDILIQRTQIYYRAHDQGLQAAHVVAARMAELLGWDQATIDHQIKRYEQDVDLSRQWRDGF
jgi:glycerol-3-phosphate dehydrogenase